MEQLLSREGWTRLLAVHREDRLPPLLGRVGNLPLSSGFGERGSVKDEVERTEERYFPIWSIFHRLFQVPFE